MTESGSNRPIHSTSSTMLRRPFDLVTGGLLKLGTLTLDSFLNNPDADPPPPETIFYAHPADTAELLQSSLFSTPAGASDADSKIPRHQKTPLFLLHQVCSQIFGNIEPLKYEIIDEGGRDKRKCILTITRPNGSSRSYTTKPEFSRKNEAKGAAATIAVDMGAIDFIKNGAPDHLSIKKGLVLAPLDAQSNQDMLMGLNVEEEKNESVKEIEQCCIEWRARRIKPHWVELSDSKIDGGKLGCALRIRLSPHSVRVYSVPTIYGTYVEAQGTCAKNAIEEGVLEFIKYGNGQLRPPEDQFPNALHDEDESTLTPLAPLSLQGFFESLPRPLPEPLEGKSLAESNASSWLNVLVQAARGARLVLNFIWITDPKFGLHGCLLRVEHPGGYKSFLVDPHFPKRADAKTAACLLAISQDIATYIREIGAAVEAKVTPEARKRAMESILPLIQSEYIKIWPKQPDMFLFPRDKDALGCEMTLKLTAEASGADVRRWTVPAEYRNKADAKAAVLNVAFDNGAVEFLRFRGQPPPENYVVNLPVGISTEGNKKRKASDEPKERTDGIKRQKMDVGGKKGMFPFPGKGKGKYPLSAGFQSKPRIGPTTHNPNSIPVAGGNPTYQPTESPGKPAHGKNNWTKLPQAIPYGEERAFGPPPRQMGYMPAASSSGFPIEPGEVRASPHSRFPHPHPDPFAIPHPSAPPPYFYAADEPAGPYHAPPPAYVSRPPYDVYPSPLPGGAYPPADYAAVVRDPYYEYGRPYYDGDPDPVRRPYGPYPGPQSYHEPPYHDAHAYHARAPRPERARYGRRTHAPGYEGAPVREGEEAPRIWEPGPHAHRAKSSGASSVPSVPSVARSAQTSESRDAEPSAAGADERSVASPSAAASASASEHSNSASVLGLASEQPSPSLASPSEAESPQSKAPETARVLPPVSDVSAPTRVSPTLVQGPADSVIHEPVSAHDEKQVKQEVDEPRVSPGVPGARATAAAAVRIPTGPRKKKKKEPVVEAELPPSPNAKATDASEKADRPRRAALEEYCAKAGISPLRFCESVASEEGGENRYKLWVIVGNERMELPTTFASVVDGHEKLSRQILKRLGGGPKKAKAP